MAFGNQNPYATMARAGTIDQAKIDEGLRTHMLSIYNYMATGLAISGLVAWLVANIPAITAIFYTPVATPAGVMMAPNILGMIAMFAPLGIILFGAFAMRNASAQATQIMYWALTVAMGVSLSMVLMVYTSESVVRVFFITAAAFGGLSLYGYTTKRSLSGMGSFLIMGLIGLILAVIVNMFLGSSMLQFIIAAAGVLIFSGLIAYDTQRLKEEYVAGMTQEAATKSAVWGALSLYISFINLFQFLLYFLGQRE